MTFFQLSKIKYMMDYWSRQYLTIYLHGYIISSIILYIPQILHLQVLLFIIIIIDHFWKVCSVFFFQYQTISQYLTFATIPKHWHIIGEFRRYVRECVLNVHTGRINYKTYQLHYNNNIIKWARFPRRIVIFIWKWRSRHFLHGKTKNE